MAKEEQNAFLAKFWLIIILIMAVLWYKSDAERIERIHELEAECERYERKIYDLEQENEQLREAGDAL